MDPAARSRSLVLFVVTAFCAHGQGTVVVDLGTECVSDQEPEFQDLPQGTVTEWAGPDGASCRLLSRAHNTQPVWTKEGGGWRRARGCLSLGFPVHWAHGSLEMWRPDGGEVEELRERRPLSKCVRMKTLRNIRGRLCVLVGVVAVR